MRTAAILLATVALAGFWALQGAAHHSAAAMDFGQSVEVEGVVQRIEVMNPHTKLILRVTDEKGTRDIEFEGHSRNNVYRSGFRDGMVKVGDKIKIRIAPMRDGSEGGYVTAFVTETGEQVGF